MLCDECDIPPNQGACIPHYYVRYIMVLLPHLLLKQLCNITVISLSWQCKFNKLLWSQDVGKYAYTMYFIYVTRCISMVYIATNSALDSGMWGGGGLNVSICGILNWTSTCFHCCGTTRKHAPIIRNVHGRFLIQIHQNIYEVYFVSIDVSIYLFFLHLATHWHYDYIMTWECWYSIGVGCATSYSQVTFVFHSCNVALST